MNERQGKAEGDPVDSIEFCTITIGAADSILECCALLERHAAGHTVDTHTIGNARQKLTALRTLLVELSGHLSLIQSGDMSPEQVRGLK